MARPPEPPKMKPALRSSGAMITAFARLKFCWSQVICESWRNPDSDFCASSTSFCCSDCAIAVLVNSAADAPTNNARPVNLVNCFNMDQSPQRGKKGTRTRRMKTAAGDGEALYVTVPVMAIGAGLPELTAVTPKADRELLPQRLWSPAADPRAEDFRRAASHWIRPACAVPPRTSRWERRARRKDAHPRTAERRRPECPRRRRPCRGAGSMRRAFRARAAA